MSNHVNRIFLFIMALAICFFGGCRHGESTPRHGDFSPGMSKAEITERFGPPAHTQTFRKSNHAIWGPIEDFWPKVPPGSAVEVWAYRTTHRMAEESSSRFPGRTELYFIDGSDTVQGIGFAMDGAVYEVGR